MQNCKNGTLQINHRVKKKKHYEEINKVHASCQYVEACVAFIHYVEKLFLDVSGKVGHRGETKSH
jgi:hypothetical protein